MTKTEALKLALEALKQERDNYRFYCDEDNSPEHSYKAMTAIEEAITAIEEVLAQPKQEPVGEVVSMAGSAEGFTVCVFEAKNVPVGTKLYITPPRREWVGLTDEEVDLMSAKFFPQDLLAFHGGMYMAQNILKEKNHG